MKIEELLARMTLAEKIGQMMMIVRQGEEEEPKTLIREGRLGAILCFMEAEIIGELQRIAVEESRLGIPLLVCNDVIHGCQTIFPIPLAEACAWDPALAEETAAAAAEEAADLGINWIFAPMVDIARDPRWGRIAEGAGEDPFLGAAMAGARVRGFQRGGRIAACPKHFAAYGGAEGGRDYNTVDISERTLREIYLPPFQAALEAGAGSVMSAFNELNGVPATANRFVLTGILREEWGFTGFVVSDFEAVKELMPHGVAAFPAEAAEKAILAGVDMEMNSRNYDEHLANLVHAGRIPAAVIDEAVRRILRIKFRLGLFARPHANPGARHGSQPDTDRLNLARRSARASIVLLKNEGTLLPLGASVKSLAVIGPLADDRAAPLGCWAAAGRPDSVATVREAIEAMAGPAITVRYTKGWEM